MIELVKKTLLTGVGIAALSKEKIEELAKDLAERGKMSEEEGRKLVDDLLKRSEESKEELQKQIEEKVCAILDKMDLAKKSEIEALRSEISELRKQVETS